MPTVKILVRHEGREFKIQMAPETTVAQFQYKIRGHLKIRPEQAIFCFWKCSKWLSSDELYAQHRTLAEIRQETKMDPLECSVLLENAFGAWSKMFVRASIEQVNGVFVLKIVYSWYGISHYEVVSVHKTKEEAQSHLLDVRCDGHLVQ